MFVVCPEIETSMQLTLLNIHEVITRNQNLFKLLQGKSVQVQTPVYTCSVLFCTGHAFADRKPCCKPYCLESTGRRDLFIMNCKLASGVTFALVCRGGEAGPAASILGAIVR